MSVGMPATEGQAKDGDGQSRSVQRAIANAYLAMLEAKKGTTVTERTLAARQQEVIATGRARANALFAMQEAKKEVTARARADLLTQLIGGVVDGAYYWHDLEGGLGDPNLSGARHLLGSRASHDGHGPSGRPRVRVNGHRLYGYG